MKRIRSFIILVFTLLFIPIIAGASSKWDTKVIHIPSTTKGVEIDGTIQGGYWGIDEIDAVYTITDEYDYEENHGMIDFRFNDLLKDETGQNIDIPVQPGDSVKISIKIVNHSKYTFKYINNSFKISTFDYAGRTDMILDNHESEIQLFDGNTLPKPFAAGRVSNVALMDLFVSSKNYTPHSWKDEGVYTISDNQTCTIQGVKNKAYLHKYSTHPEDGKVYEGCYDYLTDEVIGKELISRGYKNGIDDLAKYYLDYYNRILGTNYSSLDLIPTEVTSTIFDSSASRVISLESNQEVSSLGYNLMHNHLFTVTPGFIEKPSLNAYSDDYSVGNYMKVYNSGAETILGKEFSNTLSMVETGKSYTIPTFKMNVNGLTGNGYQNHFITCTFGFSLEDAIPKAEEVIIKDGPKIMDNVTNNTLFDYTINYNATVKNVFGTDGLTKNVIIKFIDSPTSIVDIEKSNISNNKDGIALSFDYDFDFDFEYDNTNNLIQWILTIYNVDTNKNGDLRILLNKNISLVYKNIEKSVTEVLNTVHANLKIVNSDGTSTKFINKNEELVESIDTEDYTKTTFLQSISDIDGLEIMPPHTEVSSKSSPTSYSVPFIIASVFLIFRKKFC